MTSTPGTKEQAQQAAAAAADEGKHVAGVAAEEAQNVAGEAKQQVRGLLDDAMSQADEQSRTQRDRLVSTLQTFSDDLEEMASAGGRSGLATDAARQVADRARGLSSHLDGRDPSRLLDDVRHFARNRPGVFLFGALAGGVVAGRLARGAKQAKDSAPTGYGTAPVAPSAPAMTPPPSWTPSSAPAAPTYDDQELATPPAFDPLYPDNGGTGTGTRTSPALTDGGYVEPGSGESPARYAP